MRLVTDNDTERLIKLINECEAKYNTWQDKLDHADFIWEEVIQADAEEHLSGSLDLMMQIQVQHGEIIQLWYDYINSRREYLKARLELGYE